MKKAFLKTTLVTALFAALLVGCDTGGDYGALQEEVTGLRGDYDTLRGEFDTLRGEYDTFRGEYDTFRDGLGEGVGVGN